MRINLSGIVQSFFTRLQVQREEGQALVEYTLILALIAVAVTVALTGVASAIITELGSIASSL
jgi:Flp pilus assembly pilin Flp